MPGGNILLMGMDLFVYTQSAVEDISVLVQIREWKREGNGWTCRAKNWQVVVNGSEALDTVDIGSERGELLRIRPEVQYRTEINVEGRQSSEAIVIAIASAQKAAFRLCGVIYDPQQHTLIVPVSEGLLSLFPAPGRAAPSGNQSGAEPIKPV